MGKLQNLVVKGTQVVLISSACVKILPKCSAELSDLWPISGKTKKLELHPPDYRQLTDHPVFKYPI